MPIQFTDIRTINLVLDFLAERLAFGDTLAFIAKMTSLQQELEAWSAAANDTANDMNTFASELEAYEIDSAYDLAVEQGYVGDVTSYLASLVGAKGDKGDQGLPGLGGIAPAYSGLTVQEIEALIAGSSYVVTDDGRVMQLVDNAIRNYLGSVANTTERDAISAPQHGDYVTISNVYHYYSTSTDTWVDTSSTSLPSVPPDATANPNVPSASWSGVAPVYSSMSSTDIAALAPGARVIADDGRVVQLADNAIRTDYGSVADTSARDAISSPQHGDYVTITNEGDEYHYYSTTTDAWVDTGSTTLPVVPPDPTVAPGDPASSWGETIDLPTIATFAELTRLDWGVFPEGVYVEETGRVAYRAEDVEREYNNLCGTSATAWESRGFLLDAAEADQRVRVQAEVTADTYARLGLVVNGTSTNLVVEIQPSQIRAYDSGVAEGSVIPVAVGDEVAVHRKADNSTHIQLNGRDVHTFARTQGGAVDIVAYLFGIDDCVEYVAWSAQGGPIEPVQWDVATLDAMLSEVSRVDDYVWSYVPPGVAEAIEAAGLGASGGLQIEYRASGQSPIPGGVQNIYPDGGTASTNALEHRHTVTFLVAPGESITFDGTTVTAEATFTALEPVHFAYLNGAAVRLGGNVLAA